VAAPQLLCSSVRPHGHQRTVAMIGNRYVAYIHVSRYRYRYRNVVLYRTYYHHAIGASMPFHCIQLCLASWGRAVAMPAGAWHRSAGLASAVLSR
jgi:hypothetical protein